VVFQKKGESKGEGEKEDRTLNRIAYASKGYIILTYYKLTVEERRSATRGV
jgi:hypothetical protein